jgi:CheY-like chemotaxis protein
MHAFIIEDDYLIRQSIRDMLEDLGFTNFSFARSEDAAVAGATDQKFDLITADVRLLPGDGISAVEKICAGRDIPVLFITGYSADIQERMPGAVIIDKPVKEAKLREAVTGLLAKRKR